MLRATILTALVSFSAVSIANAATVTLIYEVEKKSEPAESKADPKSDFDAVIAAVKNRLTASNIEHADVKPQGDGQIAVALADGDAKLADQVKKALSQPGNLEFRIVANKQLVEDAEIIEIALAHQADKAEKKVRDADKTLIGKWVKVGLKWKSQDSEVHRKDKEDNDEILVIIDDFNVTGKYLKSAKPVKSNEGDAVEFAFDEKGAKKFGDLTGHNLPDPVSGISRELAMIVDDKLVSAASIRSRITDSGQITNPLFTEAEINSLVSILKSGPLPAKLKLVSETAAKSP